MMDDTNPREDGFPELGLPSEETASETAPPRPPAGPPSDGPHLATVSHLGQFWDVYIEIVDDPTRTDSVRGRLCFSSADEASLLGPVRTAPIIIEPSYQEVIHKARSFEEHQFVGLLRSTLPDEDEVSRASRDGTD